MVAGALAGGLAGLRRLEFEEDEDGRCDEALTEETADTAGEALAAGKQHVFFERRNEVESEEEEEDGAIEEEEEEQGRSLSSFSSFFSRFIDKFPREDASFLS